jgi:WD40 repeat protein/tetratricopeptide (TPR) repeat protein
MQLVRGGSLAKARDQAPAGAVRQRETATLVAAVARAVHHAHQHGVLHRDLKPGNILLGAEGRPLVSDFGLARRVDQSGSRVSGAIEGTAAYMAPEQARAMPGAATTAADVYSLGAVLYQQLTGKPPFKGANDLETLIQVMEREPVPPCQLDPRVSHDLETICLKCLEKEASRRYDSAALLADDLDNFAAGRPINARPVGTLERTWRWCRRNPALAAAAAIVLIVASVAVGLIIRSRNDALAAADRANTATTEATAIAARNLELAQRNGELLRQSEKQGREVQGELARLAAQEGINLCENQGDTARGLPYLAYGLEVAEKADAKDLAHAIRGNLAAWSRNLIPPRAVLFHENSPEIHMIALSPDGQIVATACGDGAIRLWDTATGKALGAPFGTPQRPKRAPLPTEAPNNPVLDGFRLLAPEEDPAFAVAFSPDGRWIAGGTLRGRVLVWEISSGQLLREFQHHDGSKDEAFISDRGVVWANNGIAALAFRPDGKALMAAGAGGLVRLWNPSTGEKLADLDNPGSINDAVFSPDGQSLVVGCAVHDPTSPTQGVVVLWDTATGKPRYNRQEGQVYKIAFSPDGRWFATGCRKGQAGKVAGEAQLWETATGKPVGPPSRFEELLSVVAFSPDGRHWLAAGTAGTVRLFDREAGLRFEGRAGGADGPGSVSSVSGRSGASTSVRWTGTPGGVGSVSGRKSVAIGAAVFSPDGRTFVTAGDSIQAWDVSGMAIGEALKLHRAPVHTVAFSSDGRSLITAASDGTVRLWDAPTSQAPAGRSLNLETFASRLIFSRDGHRVLIGTFGPGALLLDPVGWKPPVVLEHNTAPAVDLSADGRLALTGCLDRTARIWDVGTGKMLGELTGLGRIVAVALSPDGETAAIAEEAFGAQSGGVLLWDIPSRQLRKTRLLQGSSVWALAFSPDGQTLAAIDGDRVRLFKVADATSRGISFEHGDKVRLVAFSPDGALLLTAGTSSRARLWDAATGESLHDLPHRQAIVVATFSPDGQAVLTASVDGTAQLWRTATGEPAGPALVHRQPVTAAALSRDGRTVLTGCRDGTVRLWDALAGLPLGPPAHHDGEVRCAAFSPDGRTAVWGGNGPTIDFRDLPPPVVGPTERIRLWTEALTGFTHDADHAVRLLEPDRWQQARDSVRRGGAEPVPVEDVIAWHRREAEECELTGQWFPAQWHLQRLLDEHPDNGALLWRSGLALAHLDDRVRGPKMLTKAITHGGDSAEARLELGNLFARSGKDKQAEAEFGEGIKKWDSSWALWHARGSLRVDQGHWREAAEDLRQAAERPNAPTRVVGQYALANLYLRDRKGYQAACDALLGRVEQLKTPTEFVPETADAVWPCCLGSPPGADAKRLCQLAERATDRQNGHGMEYYPLVRALGASYYRAGRYNEAVEALSRAAALNNQAPTVWLLLAMSYHRLGKAEEARRAYDAAHTWMIQSKLDDRLTFAVGRATGFAAVPDGGLAPVGAFGYFAGIPLVDMSKRPTGVRRWLDIPWPEKLALVMLGSEAANLIAGNNPGR